MTGTSSRTEENPLTSPRARLSLTAALGLLPHEHISKPALAVKPEEEDQVNNIRWLASSDDLAAPNVSRYNCRMAKSDGTPRGQAVEIKGQPATYYGTKDEQRDIGHITGRDEPKPK